MVTGPKLNQEQAVGLDQPSLNIYQFIILNADSLSFNLMCPHVVSLGFDLEVLQIEKVNNEQTHKHCIILK